MPLNKEAKSNLVVSCVKTLVTTTLKKPRTGKESQYKDCEMNEEVDSEVG